MMDPRTDRGGAAIFTVKAISGPAFPRTDLDVHRRLRGAAVAVISAVHSRFETVSASRARHAARPEELSQDVAALRGVDVSIGVLPQ
jgi:hypothetical protein